MNIGDKIPEVLGIDQNGNEIKASDYRGRKIVLYSYPRANTPGCTAEACSLQQLSLHRVKKVQKRHWHADCLSISERDSESITAMLNQTSRTCLTNKSTERR